MDEMQKQSVSSGGESSGKKATGPSSRKVAGLIVLVLILGMMYIHNLHVDAQREAELDAFMQKHGPGGVNHDNHEYIESLKVSRTKKTNAAILLGFIRGAIIGTMLGGDAGSLEGMLSFGVLNGVLFWVSEHISERV